MNLPVAVHIEDSNTYIVKLDNKTYRINDDLVEGGNKDHQLSSLDNVTIVTITRVSSHYEDSDGNILSLEKYSENENEFTKKGLYEEYQWNFSDLDDEFAHRKFRQKWNIIHKTVQTESDPIEFIIRKVKVETNNRFIIPCWGIGDIPQKDILYQYNRSAATISIVQELFKELGMIQTENDANYRDTDGKKVYSAKDKSSLRFWTAFGKYPFSGEWEKIFSITGTLEKLQKKYDDDHAKLKNILYANYAIHFRILDASVALDCLNTFVNDLYSIQTSISSIDAKRKSYDVQIQTSNKIRSLINSVEEVLKDHIEKEIVK